MSPTQETHIPTEMCFPYPGLKINAQKMRVILIICKWKKCPLANICKLESSMSPKQRERICLTSLLVEKILLAKICKCTEKLTSSPNPDTHIRSDKCSFTQET